MNNKNLYDFMNDVIEYLEQCEQGISYDEFYANMMAIKEKHEITDFELALCTQQILFECRKQIAQ